MIDGGAQHLDFIYFVYGIAFAVLAAFAAIPGRDFPEARRIPWFWIAVFAAIHGAYEWLELILLAKTIADAGTIRVTLLTLSFLPLFEFSRRALGIARGPLWAIVAAVVLPITILISKNCLLEAEAVGRLAIGGTSAWLAAWGLWRASTDERETAPGWLKVGAAALAAYGILVCVTSSEVSCGWHALTSAHWLAITGIPVQLLRAGCALILAVAAWRHGMRHAPAFILHTVEPVPRRLRATLIALLLVITGAWLGAEHAGRRASQDIRSSILQRTTVIASLLDAQLLTQLLESPHDATHPVVRAVEEHLTQAKRAFPDLELIYLYGMRGQEFVFYASSEAADPDARVRPGDVYEGDLVEEDYQVFTAARSMVTGPFRDRWGEWVSAAVPALRDANAPARTLLALGADIRAVLYTHTLRRARLIPLGAGALLALIILDFFSRHHRLVVAAMQLAEAERQQRRLSEELDRRVQQRTRELAEANAALQVEMARHQEAETKFRALTEQIPVITYRVDLHPEPRTVYISPQLHDILGYDPAVWMADPDYWKRALHPEDADRVIAAVKDADQTGRPLLLDTRMRSNTGAIRWFRIGWRYQFDDQGRPSSAHGVMLDITEQVQTDARLKETGERYRLLFEHSPAGLFQFDRGLCITDVNDRFAALLGKRRIDLLGVELKQLAPDKLCASFQAAFNGGESYYEGSDVFQGMPADAWIGVRTAPIFGAEHTVIGGIVIVEDMTERRRIEEERLRAQKLESLGLLAGGIAHDFNNILTAVLGNISIARQSAPTVSDIREALQDAERAALRARDLTHQLLTFSKGGAPIKKLHDVAALVREAASFTVRGSASRCIYEFAPDTWAAEVDGGQLTQVIQNLIINADQAMPNGGLIRLRVANRILKEGEVDQLPAGRYVEIKVSDTGTGIPERLLHRIFDPYFTTKAKGSGLGLTMCFSILKKHGGHIGVESRVGVGTTFTLLLPAADGTLSEENSSETRSPEFFGQGRVLVMDDERPILNLARRLLEKNGYTVLTAESGEEALELVDAERAAGRGIDLAILDITVPGGMGGRETLRHLRARDPGIPALVSSGYAQDEVMAQFKDAGFTGVVPKPYRAEDLLAAVSRALAAARSA